LGYNHFWKFWNEAEKGANGFKHHFIPYTEIPGRDEKWAEEQFKLLGELKYNQEVLCEFLGSSNTLINARTIAQLSSKEPIFYNEDGLSLYENPQEDHYYCITVDTARGIGGDYSAFVVTDITEMPYKVVATYRNNKVAPLLYPEIINKLGRDYNNAYILIENNDIGGQVVEILHEEIEYENIFTTVTEKSRQYVTPGFGRSTRLGVNTSKQVKRQGCFTFKSLMEEKKLLIFDAEIIHEISTFIEKGQGYQADEGYHDDLVMCMVLFGWLSTMPFFKELVDVNTRDGLYNKQMKSISQELTPFIHTKSNDGPKPWVASGDYWIVDEEYSKRIKDFKF